MTCDQKYDRLEVGTDMRSGVMTWKTLLRLIAELRIKVRFGGYAYESRATPHLFALYEDSVLPLGKPTVK